MRWSHGLTLGCVLALAGCGVPPQMRGPMTAAHPVFATQLAGPSTYLAPMPTAMVILKPDDTARNRALCVAMAARLPTAEQALGASVVAPNLVLTRWLVQLPEVPAAKATDCDYLVSTYDYARATRLMHAARLSEGRFAGRGPFLVMVNPDGSGLHVAGLDGSAVSEAEFGTFVDSWGRALRQTEAMVTRTPDRPGLVRSFFDLIAAILRTVAGITGGVIQGVLAGL
jgi:hypothetical protein